MTDKITEIENLLSASGMPYYVSQERASDLTGIPRWRIRHAIDSRSVATAGNGCVTRHALAKWIAGQPAIVRRMRESKPGKPVLTLTPEIITAGKTITVTGPYPGE